MQNRSYNFLNPPYSAGESCTEQPNQSLGAEMDPIRVKPNCSTARECFWDLPTALDNISEQFGVGKVK